jgi:hypothetical protein
MANALIYRIFANIDPGMPRGLRFYDRVSGTRFGLRPTLAARKIPLPGMLPIF